MRKIYLAFFAALLILFTACQKEADFPPGQNPGNPNNPGNPGNPGNPSGQSIIGNYDFVGLTAHTIGTTTANDGGDQIRTVTVSYYTSKNNTGTYTINATQFISNNIGYSIDTTMNSKIYINGVLTDDFDLPFQGTVPPASNTVTYVKNTADSLTVTGPVGPITGPSGTPPPTGAMGYKYSWSGDTLVLKTTASFTQNVNQGGVQATVSQSATVTARLKKKP